MPVGRSLRVISGPHESQHFRIGASRYDDDDDDEETDMNDTPEPTHPLIAEIAARKARIAATVLDVMRKQEITPEQLLELAVAHLALTATFDMVALRAKSAHYFDYPGALDPAPVMEDTFLIAFKRYPKSVTRFELGSWDEEENWWITADECIDADKVLGALRVPDKLSDNHLLFIQADKEVHEERESETD